jgi:hypothetical protein
MLGLLGRAILGDDGCDRPEETPENGSQANCVPNLNFIIL